MPFQPQSYQGILHHYTSRLTAFEHVPKQAPANTQAVAANVQTTGSPLPPPCHNYVLFLGGLGDGLCTVNYPHIFASTLQSSETLSRWRVIEVLLSSSYGGWTTSNLAKDAAEVAKCVAYFRSLQTCASANDQGHDHKIILLGHSTGCQITMEYLVGPSTRALLARDSRPQVDGAVLQAGISDREGILSALNKEQYDSSCVKAKEWVQLGKGDEVLGNVELPDPAGSLFGARPTALRWLSLAGPDGPGTGGDDYFSLDVPEDILATTFGAVNIPLCVLLSGDDEHMADWVSKDNLIEMWRQAVAKGGGKWSASSGVVPGASHNLNRSKDATVAELIRRIGDFLRVVQPRELKQSL